MRYAFVGAVSFSARCLDTLLSMPVDVAAILCPRKAPNSDYLDLGATAAKHGREVRYFGRIGEEADFIRSVKPDVLFVLGLSQLIPSEILALPTIGCIGSHPAALPRNRGRHPIVWAIANGLTESALSFLFLDAGIDSGDIWLQRPFSIGAEDDAGNVYERICELGSFMLRQGVEDLERGIIRRAPQDHASANVWRRRTAKDGRIDWRMSSKRIHDLVRALRPPYPGASMAACGAEYKVWRTRLVEEGAPSNLEPGKVLRVDSDGFIVKTGDGLLAVLEHELPRPPQEGDYLE